MILLLWGPGLGHVLAQASLSSINPNVVATSRFLLMSSCLGLQAAKRISKKHREEWLETQKELDKWDLKHEQVGEEDLSAKETGKGTKGSKGKKPPPGPVPKPKDVKSGNKLLTKAPEKLEVDPSQLPDPLLWGKVSLALSFTWIFTPQQ